MIAYLDLPAGLSGDMFLACLVDAGWPVEALRETVTRLKLPAEEWSVEARSVMKGALRATLVEVRAAEGHHHRHLADIKAIIEAADLPAPVKQRAVAVFTRLAEAEAKVHGTTPQKVHFHEVGAVDAIIDIVGVCAGLHALGVEALHCGGVPLGEGWADTAHGRIPVPAPATLELLTAAHAPTRPNPGAPAPPCGEVTTPTAAALLAELATFGQPVMELSRIGLGAGRRDCPWPNVARLWLGQPKAHGPLVLLETNIDDMNPQLYQGVSDRLFAAGARDVWLTPVQMKKGRPAVVLTALAPAEYEPALAHLILRETTTLGVRTLRLDHRYEARRELRQIDTPFGAVNVKLKWVDRDLVGAAPEYDDCAALARQQNVPVRQVYETALAAAQELANQLRDAMPADPVPPAPPPPPQPGHEHDHDHGHGRDHSHPH